MNDPDESTSRPDPAEETPPVLNYGHLPDAGLRRTRGAGQFFLGLVTELAVAGGAVYASMSKESTLPGTVLVYAFATAAVLILGLILRQRYGWGSFVRGILTGIALTLLVPPIALYVICGK